MTLDEAIAKAKADGDVQLAEWLRQARGADAAARWYTEKLRDANRTIRKLLDESAKLREVVADGELNAREILDENEQLRERLKASDDGRERQADNLIDKCHKIARLQGENSKLRNLAKQMHVCLTRPKVYNGKQPYLTATECPYFTEGACDYSSCGFEHRLQALGIEVPE